MVGLGAKAVGDGGDRTTLAGPNERRIVFRRGVLVGAGGANRRAAAPRRPAPGLRVARRRSCRDWWYERCDVSPDSCDRGAQAPTMVLRSEGDEAAGPMPDAWMKASGSFPTRAASRRSAARQAAMTRPAPFRGSRTSAWRVSL